MNAPTSCRALPAFVAVGGSAFGGATLSSRPGAAAICGAPVVPPVAAAPVVVVGLPALGGDVTMRCRRNLKLEKRARNRANGRTFKKSKPRFFNRNAVDTTADKDTEFLSSIFNVLTFDARSSGPSDDRKKGSSNKDRRPRS